MVPRAVNFDYHMGGTTIPINDPRGWSGTAGASVCHGPGSQFLPTLKRIDEQLLAGFVFLAQDDILPAAPALVQLCGRDLFVDISGIANADPLGPELLFRVRKAGAA